MFGIVCFSLQWIEVYSLGRYFAEKRRVVEKGSTLLELVAASVRVEKDIRDQSFGVSSIPELGEVQGHELRDKAPAGREPGFLLAPLRPFSVPLRSSSAS